MSALSAVACGLLEAEGPPARTVGEVPGASDEPVPLPQNRDAPGARDPTAPAAPLPDPPLPGYELAWRDEFDGAALDLERWTVNEGPWRDALNAPTRSR